MKKYIAIVLCLFLFVLPALGETPATPTPAPSIIVGRVLLSGDSVSIERDGQANTLLKLAPGLSPTRLIGFLQVAKDRPLECLVSGDLVTEVRLPEDGHITFRCQHCACRMFLKTASQWELPCKACSCGKSTETCYGEHH